MYPKDNVFQIYFNIGKRLPFQVKRCQVGLKGSYDEDYRYSQQGRTFMVERIALRNKIYGTAYGYCMIDGVRDDDNDYMKNYEKGTVPCAGCAEWVLIDIPGVDMNEVFPVHKPDFIVPFGIYKGKTLAEIYAIDSQYVYWLANSDRYFRIDFTALKSIENKIERVGPKITPDDVITFGKYKGRTYKDVIKDDPDYIKWALYNVKNINFDVDAFLSCLSINDSEK